MYNLKVEVHTPVGHFIGLVNGEPIDEEMAIRARDGLQKVTNDTKYLTIYGEEGEITFPGEICKNSVFVWRIEEIN